MDQQGDADDADLDRMNEALRTWYVAFSEFGREFGLHHGLHGSDAAALVHITTAEDQGAPLTQTQLARRIGLTAPATSSLLNRLEDAGHVERHRTRVDRRVVTLRSTPAMHEQVHAFFRDVGAEVDRVASSYPPETITAVTRLLGDITGVLHRHLDERQRRHR